MCSLIWVLLSCAVGSRAGALSYFHAAFDAVAQLGDQRALATAYMNMGSAHYSLNNYEARLARTSQSAPDCRAAGR